MADQEGKDIRLDEKRATPEDAVSVAASRLEERLHKRRRNTPPCPVGCELGPGRAVRAAQSFNYRYEAAVDEYLKLPSSPTHNCNGDEVLYKAAHYIGSFTKGLPHDINGEVDPSAYCKLLTALDSGQQSDFNKVPLGCKVECRNLENPSENCECTVSSRKLEDPQGSYSFDLEGADSHSLEIPPAPTFASVTEVSEILENYWMALARDIPFIDFPPSALVPSDIAHKGIDHRRDGPLASKAIVQGLAPRRFARVG
ncbi:MAG: hypothetical protein H0V35_07805 [Nitrospira sp.]|nr:hypothetical protein [Nitrospira sp.]